MCTIVLQIVCCLLTAKAIVIICSGALAISYFAVCVALREYAFPFLKTLHESWPSYFIIKYSHIPVMDWINTIKVLFYGALVYTLVGLCGLLGALLEVQLFLWAYAVYLCISAYLSCTKIYEVLQSFLKTQDEIRKACKKVEDILKLNCDEKFEEYELGAGVIALLMCTTLICTFLLIRRIHIETGSYLFTFCGTSIGGDGKGTSNELAKGWERQRVYRGRVRRGGDGEGGIEMKRMRARRGWSESSSSSDDSEVGRTLELPRR
ncbi:uncharacterized protein JCM6883_000392 [Sporobolomyces salmoneus]|uniref:uncharacterized protein n=1 Tax=Sporobolomyces salmoneus TaxID=183962 RepID=UPI00317EF895